MTTIDLDECTDVTGGFMWPPVICEPRFPFPPFPPFPDPIGGGPIAITAWFPVCALVD